MNLGGETHCESKMSCARKNNNNNNNSSTVSLARARTPTARYETARLRSNHEVAVPLILDVGVMHYCLHMTGAGKVVTFDIS